MTVRIGLGLFTGQVPRDSGRTIAEEYADTLALARLAERVGFDSFWVSEHHGAADSYLPSLMVMLAAVAGVTKRLTLGTAVALAPFQHPLRFAEDCAVVDQLSQGRLVVGLGIGWRKREFTSFGVPMAERVGRTVELIRICRAAWEGAPFTFAGKHVQFRDAMVTPRPYRNVPILLGGSVPEAAARAGRIADGFMGTPKNDIAAFRRQVAVFDDAARAAGRDPDGLSIGFHVDAWLSREGGLPEHVRAAMAHMVATYAVWREQDAGNASAVPASVDDAELRGRAIIGTPADLVAQLRPWVVEFGHRDLQMAVRLHYPGMTAEQAAPAVGLFASDVMAQLRDTVLHVS